MSGFVVHGSGRHKVLEDLSAHPLRGRSIYLELDHPAGQGIGMQVSVEERHLPTKSPRNSHKG